jgi:hypothetical protein
MVVVLVVAVAIGTLAISIAGGALLGLHRDVSPRAGALSRNPLRLSPVPNVANTSYRTRSANAFSKDVPASIAARPGRRAPDHTEVVVRV